MDDATVNRDEINFKREQLRLDRERLELEKEKLKIEREMRKWSIFSVFIPLMIVAVTISFNNLNQVRQARMDFALKATEIVINSQSPSEIQDRMTILSEIFPDQLPDDFMQLVSSFDAASYSGPPSYDNKMNFLRLIGDNYEQKQEIITMYKQLLVVL